MSLAIVIYIYKIQNNNIAFNDTIFKVYVQNDLPQIQSYTLLSIFLATLPSVLVQFLLSAKLFYFS